MDNKPHVAIIIPAYNEADNLGILLPRIQAVVQESNYEPGILVINDLGEKDQQLENVCAQFHATVLNTPHNMGSQEAINFGIRQQVENFKADFFDHMDADIIVSPSNQAVFLSIVLHAPKLEAAEFSSHFFPDP